MSGLWQWLAELAWWIRLGMSIAAFVGAALLTGWVVTLAGAILGREVSQRILLWSRLGGGAVGGVVAWLFLHFGPPGIGFGEGGTGTGTASAPAAVQQLPPAPNSPLSSPVRSTSEPALPRWKLILRIKLLGPNSDPPFAPPDKYFAILGVVSANSGNAPAVVPSTWPKEPINADGILRLVEQLRQDGSLEAVELHVTPYSASLRHNEVGKLRRLLMEVKVRFDYPPDAEQPQYSRLVDR